MKVTSAASMSMPGRMVYQQLVDRGTEPDHSVRIELAGQLDDLCEAGAVAGDGERLWAVFHVLTSREVCRLVLSDPTVTRRLFQ
jgi:hypothetical protein